ncbi:hypothetical protein [Burkholderia gladioli]|uniref:hypothetical protein n=1 Tax=Burkholderia gladioli TaxID=28095 RepID=UPI0015E66740|nr:hypothetical protein [Burkholderia gladioli]MBA1364068.1 hypothetical protein [Burkholderia gladioli]
MTTTNLIRWIDSHLPPEPTRDNGDGTLTVASACVDRAGLLFIEYETIPATLGAARDLLGY